MDNPKIPYISVAVLFVFGQEESNPRPLSVRQWREKLIKFFDGRMGRFGNSFSKIITLIDIEDVFENFSAGGLLNRYDDPNTETYWEIQKEAVTEYLTTNLADYAEKYFKLGDSWLFEALENLTYESESEGNLLQLAEGGGLVAEHTASPDIVDGDMIGALADSSGDEDSTDQVPASDRFVSFDHNDPRFKEMQSAVDEAAEVLPKSNQWEGEDKEAVLEHLSFGRQLLKSKNKKIAVGAISALLLAPLYAAYVAISEEVFKDLIMAAIKAVGTYFGI